MEYNIHDLFVRSVMRFPDVSIPFLKSFMEADVLDRIELKGLELSAESYVSKRLREKISDVVFKVPYREITAYFYILIEHKSSGAIRGRVSSFAWQMVCQQIALMDAVRKQNPQGYLPLVRCLGLYHGKTPYRGAMSVAEHIQGPAELIPAHWREPIALVDLGTKTDKELIEKGGKLAIFLLVLKHIYDDNPIIALRQLQKHLAVVEHSQDGIDFIETVILYLMDTVKSQEIRHEVEQFAVQSLSEEGGARVLALGESYRREEREKWEKVVAREQAERMKEQAARKKAQAEKVKEQAAREREQEKRMDNLYQIFLFGFEQGLNLEACRQRFNVSNDDFASLVKAHPDLNQAK